MPTKSGAGWLACRRAAPAHASRPAQLGAVLDGTTALPAWLSQAALRQPRRGGNLAACAALSGAEPRPPPPSPGAGPTFGSPSGRSMCRGTAKREWLSSGGWRGLKDRSSCKSATFLCCMVAPLLSTCAAAGLQPGVAYVSAPAWPMPLPLPSAHPPRGTPFCHMHPLNGDDGRPASCSRLLLPK